MRGIREKALSVKHKYNTSNPFDVISFENIELLKVSLCSSVKVFFQVIDGINIIYINSDLPYEAQCVAAAHELGHYFCHSDEYTMELRNNSLQFPSKYEAQADIFAAEFLLDDDIFSNYHDRTAHFIASCENVPVHFVDIKYKSTSNM